jgi:hypothetical protein
MLTRALRDRISKLMNTTLVKSYIFYTDTLFSKVMPLARCTCALVATNGSATRVYPMAFKSRSNIAFALQGLIDDIGIPDKLICNFASEQTGKNTDLVKLICRGITQNHRVETEIKNQNQVEGLYVF